MERHFKTIFMIMLIIMYSGCWLSETFGAEITLRYAGNLPLGHHVTKGQELFAKMIEEKTGGKVKVQVYPAGQLFSDKDMMKALPAGAVEMAAATLSQWTGLVPRLLFLDLPFFFRDQRHLWSMLDGKVGEVLNKDLEEVGVKLLYWVDCGSFDFASKKPIRVLEDFKGKRIRVIGEMASESITALGAAPVFMGGGEMYMALQRGTVDGANTLVASFCERKFHEVTKYVTTSNYAFATVGSLMNLKKWNELPSDIQKIILDCAVEAQQWSREEAGKMDRECLGSLSGKGMEIYTVPEKERERWKKAIQPAIDIFLKRTGGKGEELMKIAEKVR